MKVWFCYLDVRPSACREWHEARVWWTEENRRREPYPRGHEACGFVTIPDKGEKPEFELVGQP